MTLLYDNTFDGLMTAVFEAYRLKLNVFHIVPTIDHKEKLFTPIQKISTNKAKANRLKLGIIRKTDVDHLPYLYQLFSAKNEGRELVIYQFIKEIFELSTL